MSATDDFIENADGFEEDPLAGYELDSVDEQEIDDIVDEVSNIIEFLRKGDEKGATSREIGRAMGIRQETVRKHLRDIADRGRLKTGRKRITAIDGKSVMVPTYWIASDSEDE